MENAVGYSTKERLVVADSYIRANPQGAENFLSDYNSAKAKAVDTNPHNLFDYFFLFCKIQGYTSIEEMENLRGPIHKKEKVDLRRLFIGALVRIYRPQILFSPICLENGLGENLCRILKMDNGNMTKAIDECRAWYCSKTNPDFRNQVEETVQELKDRKNGYVGSIFSKSVA